MITHKGQAILEYLIIIAVIVMAAITMQKYAKRGLQALVKVAADGMGEQNAVFAKKEDMYSRTTTDFAGSCSQPDGRCSSIAGSEITEEGIPFSDALALKAKGAPLGPLPLTAAEYSNITTSGLPADGKVFYYAFPTATNTTSTQSIKHEERAGGEKYTEILQSQSNTVLLGASTTEYYEKQE